MKEIKFPKEMTKSNRIAIFQLCLTFLNMLICSIFFICIIGGICLFGTGEYSNGINTTIVFLVLFILGVKLNNYLWNNSRYYCHNNKEWENLKRELYIKNNKKWVI